MQNPFDTTEPLNETEKEICRRIVKRASNHLAELPKKTRQDIYALCFAIDDKMQGVENCYVVLGYNTHTYLKERVSQGESDIEFLAKWHAFGYWGACGGDQWLLGLPEDKSLLKSWVTEQNYFGSEDERTNDFNSYCQRAHQGRHRIWELIIVAALDLRRSAEFVELFGCDLPILVGNGDLDEEGDSAIRAANPQGQADEYFQPCAK